jgi:hypothetical protein
VDTPPVVFENDDSQWITMSTNAHKSKELLDERRNMPIQKKHFSDFEHDFQLTAMMPILLQECFSAPKNEICEGLARTIETSMPELQLPDNAQSVKVSEITHNELYIVEKSQDRFSPCKMDLMAAKCDGEIWQETSAFSQTSNDLKSLNDEENVCDRVSEHFERESDCTIQINANDERNCSQPTIAHIHGSLPVEEKQQKKESDENANEVLEKYRTLKKNELMSNGTKLLGEYSAGTLQIERLTRLEINAMTLACGGKMLPNTSKGGKQAAMQHLQTVMQNKSCELSIQVDQTRTESQILLAATMIDDVGPKIARKPNFGATVGSSIASAAQSVLAETPVVSAIELVHRKYGVANIAKMLADRVAQCPYDIDDLFTRLQIMDMLALGEGAVQKPSRLTRNLHELSMDPIENLATLEEKMDHFASLIEKSMVPIKEGRSLLETEPSSPKGKKRRTQK